MKFPLQMVLTNILATAFSDTTAPGDVAHGIFDFLKLLLVFGGAAPTLPNGRQGEGEIQSLGVTGPFSIELRGRLLHYSPIITYRVVCNGSHGGAIVSEVLQYRRGSNGVPVRVLDFVGGSGTFIANESLWHYENIDPQFQQIALPRGRLALSTVMQNINCGAASDLGRFLLDVNDRRSPPPVVTIVSRMQNNIASACE